MEGLVERVHEQPESAPEARESLEALLMSDIFRRSTTESAAEVLPAPLDTLSLSANSDTDHTTDSPQPPRPTDKLHIRKRKSPHAPANEKTTKPPAQTGLPAAKKPRKASRRIATTRHLSNPSELGEISIAMSTNYDLARLEHIRSSFCDALLQIPKPAGSRHKLRPGQDPSKLFDAASAAQLTQFFFEDTMGAPGAEQLVKFIVDYKPEGGSKADAGAAARLRGIAMDSNAPLLVQKFCASFSVELREENNELSLNNHIAAMTRAISTFESYTELSRHIDGNHAELWTYLTAKLGRDRVNELKADEIVVDATGRGVGKASRALRTLSALVNLPQAVITSRIDRARAVDLLVGKMGRGFMLVMPPKSIAFLKDMGIGRIGPACDILHQHCPYIKEFVGLLEEYVLNPYENGADELPLDVDLLQPSTDGEVMFLDQLKSAGTQYLESNQSLLQGALRDGIAQRFTEVTEDDA